MEAKNRYVGMSVIKKDAKALLAGKPLYTDDIAPKDCLIVKLLRSPHAHALIEEIDLSRALKVEGIETILTYQDCSQKRFTMAGQTYPEPSPYDRLILDQRVRFVGDAVAIVAGETEEAVDKALRLIKVKYQVLEPVLDFHTAKDNPILVHRRTAGRVCARLAPTINATSVPLRRTAMVMWMRSWQTVPMLLTARIM